VKAIAVHPGVPGSAHLVEAPKPSIDDVPGGRGVLVEVLRVGVDGTDREINEALYSAAPPGEDYLIIGDERFGRVVEVGPEVPDTIRPGGYVVASVRRPGTTIYGRIGLQEAQALFPGWLEQLLTTPIRGLENYEQMIRALTEDDTAIKVYVEVNGSR
jgi:threonine dehydrogenase-like Zn-dependent dehydrogenase